MLKHNPNLINLIVRDYQDGKSGKQIAMARRISEYWVYRALHQAGVKVEQRAPTKNDREKARAAADRKNAAQRKARAEKKASKSTEKEMLNTLPEWITGPKIIGPKYLASGGCTIQVEYSSGFSDLG